jgi:hypothetical protein
MTADALQKPRASNSRNINPRQPDSSPKAATALQLAAQQADAPKSNQ